MIQLPEDRRPPLTPQLALRVAVIGSFALAMFAIIFFRLWFLQVLSGDQYLAQASVNRVRDIAIPAPARRDPRPQRQHSRRQPSRAIAVQLSPPDLPQATASGARRVYHRLAGVLGIGTRPRRCLVAGHGVLRLAPIPCDVAQQQALLPYANVTLKTDVSATSTTTWPNAADQFPGVNVEQVWLRSYPLGDTAAQLFGTVGPINATEVHAAALPRRLPERDRRPVRARVVLRPLPARHRRRRPGPGRRARPLPGLPGARQAGGRPHAEALARPRPAEGRRAGAAAGDQQQSARDRPAPSWR